MIKPSYIIAFFFLFTSFALGYTVNGDLFQQTTQTQEFYEWHASPVNSTNTNITTTAVSKVGNQTRDRFTTIDSGWVGNATLVLSGGRGNFSRPNQVDNAQKYFNSFGTINFSAGSRLCFRAIFTDTTNIRQHKFGFGDQVNSESAQIVVTTSTFSASTQTAGGFELTSFGGAGSPKQDDLWCIDWNENYVAFYQNSTLVANHTTKIPVGTLPLTFTTSSAAGNVSIDYLEVNSNLLVNTPIISSLNDSNVLDFAETRDDTERVLIGTMYQGGVSISRFAPITTFNIVMNLSNSASGTRIAVQDISAGWAAGFNTNGVENQMTCTGFGATASAAFDVPDYSNPHNYTVKVFPDRVECWIDGDFYKEIAHTNTAQRWRPFVTTVNTGTNLNISSIVYENLLSDNTNITTNADGTGRLDWFPDGLNLATACTNSEENQTIGKQNIFTKTSGIEFDSVCGYVNLPPNTNGSFTYKVTAPLGYNISRCGISMKSFFSSNVRWVNSSYSTDLVNWVDVGMLSSDNTFENHDTGAIDFRTIFINYTIYAPAETGFINGIGWNCTIANTSITTLPILVPGNNTLTINQSSLGSGQINVTFSRTETIGNLTYSIELPESTSTTHQRINLNPNIGTNNIVNVSGFLFYDDNNEGLGTQFNDTHSFTDRNATANASNTSHHFLWAVNTTFTNGNWTLMRQNETFNQFVYMSNATDCSFGGTPTLNFTPLQEENNTIQRAEIEVNFDFVTPDGTINRSAQFSVTNVENLTICLPPATTQLFATSFLQYENQSDFEKRFHFLHNASLTTTLQTIPLLMENSVQSQQTQILLQNSVRAPQANLFIRVQRYFPSSNTYSQVVEGLTGADGKTIIPLRTRDVYYRFLIVDTTGSVLFTFPQQQIPCDESATLCLLTLSIPATIDGETYLIMNSSERSCALTNTTVTCNVSDTSGIVTSWNLSILRHGLATTTRVCASNITASSGALSCNVSLANASLYDHTYSLQVFYNPLAKIVESGSLPKSVVNVYGVSGVLATFLLTLTLLFIGMFNPTVGIGLAFIGLVASAWMGLFTISAAALTGMLVIVILFGYKMKT